MTRLVHLHALQALEAALRHGTLKEAARELGITQAAAGQRVRALERYLQAPLLERGPGGVRPTQQARHALSDLHDGFERLRHAAEALNLDRQAEVHLRADPDWVELWLAPRMPSLEDFAPTLELVLEAPDAPRRRRVDVEIARSADPAADILEAERVAPVLCEEHYYRVHSHPPPDLLEGFPLLHLDQDGDTPEVGWPDWIARYGYRRTGAELGVRYRSVALAVKAAEAGAGALLCPLSLVRQRLAEGSLLLLFDPALSLPARNSFRLRLRKDAARRRSVRQFLAWLQAERQRPDGVSGT